MCENANGNIKLIVIIIMDVMMYMIEAAGLCDCHDLPYEIARVDHKILVVMAAVADGTVHPLTATTLSFLKRLFIYRSALHILFQDTSSPTPKRQDATRLRSAHVLPVQRI